jgi:hypothetical protein
MTTNTNTRRAGRLTLALGFALLVREAMNRYSAEWNRLVLLGARSAPRLLRLFLGAVVAAGAKRIDLMAARLVRSPSHADKRRARRRQLLGEEIRTVLRAGPTEMEIDAAIQRFLQENP